jgi:hypothetical protein
VLSDEVFGQQFRLREQQYARFTQQNGFVNSPAVSTGTAATFTAAAVFSLQQRALIEQQYARLTQQLCFVAAWSPAVTIRPHVATNVTINLVNICLLLMCENH